MNETLAQAAVGAAVAAVAGTVAQAVIRIVVRALRRRRRQRDQCDDSPCPRQESGRDDDYAPGDVSLPRRLDERGGYRLFPFKGFLGTNSRRGRA
ncbi:MAG: hypothetical protein M3442_12315 [Chloroflexota bacterium]|nr:hypothetical protein [Chloroflexota bacterium]